MHHEGTRINTMPRPLFDLEDTVIAAAVKARGIILPIFIYQLFPLRALLSSSQNLVNLKGVSLSQEDLVLIAGFLRYHLHLALHFKGCP